MIGMTRIFFRPRPRIGSALLSNLTLILTNSMMIFTHRQQNSLAAFILATGMIVSSQQMVMAHAGHDHEFSGGNAEQVMQPLTIDATAASALGLKTTAIAAGDTILIPSSSVVDTNGNQLIYVQNNGTYQPIPVKLGKTAGDLVELAEGNVKAGDQVVSQGAPLLYSEALRRKPEAVTTAPTTTAAPADANAPHEHGPNTHTHDDQGGVSRKKLALGLVAGILTGGGIMFGLSKRQKNSVQE
jgi:membrane fusion protein, cation efflux system